MEGGSASKCVSPRIIMEYDLSPFPLAKVDKGKLLALRPMIPVADSDRKSLLFMIFLYVLLQRYNFSDNDEAKSGGKSYLCKHFFVMVPKQKLLKKKLRGLRPISTRTYCDKYTYLWTEVHVLPGGLT